MIELPYATLRYEAPVVCIEYKDGTELGFPEIKELTLYAEKLSGYKPYFTFSDVVHSQVSVTEQGKRFIQDRNNIPLFRGGAILVKNAIYEFAVNFLHFYTKPQYPLKAFTSRKKAMAWLLTLPLE